MQTIERHGGSSHFVRPDGVYRTSVLQPSIGYDPGADVQAVAASFTQYPANLQTPNGLSGLFGADLRLADKIRMRIAVWRAKRRAKRTLQGLGMMPAGRGGAIQPAWGAAYPQVGEQIAPHMIAKEQMVAYLVQSGNQLPPAYADAQAATSWHRWSDRWWNG
ncbi:MAG: hypothetical protein ACREJC_04490 [Tepidisphaeraceae bacterium]